MKAQDIINAYCKIRTIDQTIPDDVLDFMKESALEKLKEMDLSQEEIKFDNTCLRLEVGEYKKHDIKSLGGILHFLQAFGLNQYDIVTVGFNADHIGEINLYGERIATFTYDENKNMPIFSFNSKFQRLQTIQDNYTNGLEQFQNKFKK